MLAALTARRAFFKSMGATATDHAVLEPYTERLSDAGRGGELFDRALNGLATLKDQSRFEAHMLLEMARMSADDGLASCSCIPGHSAISNRAVVERFGPDTGGDISRPAPNTREICLRS